MSGRSARHRRQPGPDRRGHGARGDRRRLPVLQRQPGPAVRADLQAQGRGAQRRQPRHGQRGADRRLARRRGRRRSRQARRRTARASRCSTSSSRRTSRRCRRTRPCSSARARRSASSTSRSRAGTSKPGLRRTAPRSRSRSATPAAGRVRRVREHVRRADARRPIAGRTCSASATRSPAAAQSSTPRSARFRPLLRDIIPVAQQPVVARARTWRASSRRSSATAAQRRARSAETQAELFVNLDTTFARARARSRGPFIQDSITEGPPRSTRRSASFPHQRPFLRNTAAALPRAAARRAARCAPRRPALADALEIGTPTLRAAVALNRRLEPLLQRAAGASPRTRMVAARRQAASPRRVHDAASPTLDFLAPAQTHATT